MAGRSAIAFTTVGLLVLVAASSAFEQTGPKGGRHLLLYVEGQAPPPDDGLIRITSVGDTGPGIDVGEYNPAIPKGRKPSVIPPKGNPFPLDRIKDVPQPIQAELAGPEGGRHLLLYAEGQAPATYTPEMMYQTSIGGGDEGIAVGEYNPAIPKGKRGPVVPTKEGPVRRGPLTPQPIKDKPLPIDEP